MSYKNFRTLVAAWYSLRVVPVCAIFLALFAMGCSSVLEEQQTGGPGGSGASTGVASTGGSGGAGGCAAGKITTLAENQGHPTQILVDATHVYWRGSGLGAEVRSVAKTGGTPSVIVSGQAFVDAITVDADQLYWTGTPDPKSPTDDIHAVAKTGGASKKLATTKTQIAGIASDQGNLYLTTYSGEVLSMPSAGAAPTVLLAIPQQVMRDVVVDDARVYWFNAGQHNIMSMPKLGGDPSLFVEKVGETIQIGHDDDRLYWNGGGVILAKPKSAATSDAPDVVAFTKSSPSRVVVDASCIYWTTSTTLQDASPALWAAPKSGGDPVQIAEGMEASIPLVVDETGVYWADNDTGAIMRLAK